MPAHFCTSRLEACLSPPAAATRTPRRTYQGDCAASALLSRPAVPTSLLTSGHVQCHSPLPTWSQGPRAEEMPPLLLGPSPPPREDPPPPLARPAMLPAATRAARDKSRQSPATRNVLHSRTHPPLRTPHPSATALSTRQSGRSCTLPSSRLRVATRAGTDGRCSAGCGWWLWDGEETAHPNDPGGPH